MRTKISNTATILLLTAVSLAACQPDTRAQEMPDESYEGEVVPAPELRKSPMAIAAGRLSDGTYVKIVYSSPRKRGRRIFGGLVPFGEVWRTGANEATELTVTGPVMMAGNRLEAGTYALFTVPRRDSWTIVVNGTLGQWGAYDYDELADVLRFDLPTTRSENTHEAFTISIDETENGASIKVVWENTAVSIPVSPPEQ